MDRQPRTQEELLAWIVEQIQILKRGKRQKRASSTDGQRIVFTPVISNGINLGNGSVTGSYVKSGKRAHVQITMTIGSTTAVTGDIRFESPLPPAFGVQLAGNGRVVIAGTQYDATTLVTGGLLYIRFRRVSGSNVVQTSANATVPTAWAAGTLQASFDFQLT